MWLTLREEPHIEAPGVSPTSNTSSDENCDPVKTPSEAEPHVCGTFRLIGETYVSGAASGTISEEEHKWFKLW